LDWDDDLLESLPDLAAVLDPAGVIHKVNGEWRTRLGLAPERMRGRSCAEFLHPADLPVARAAFEALCTGETLTRLPCRWSDGAEGWLDLDIAARKRVSTGLILLTARVVQPDAHAAARLEELEAVSGVGSWETSVDAGRMYWSPMTCRIHDLPPNYRPDLNTALSFFTPEARRVVTEAFDRLRRDGTPYDLELPFVTATGRDIWVRATGAAQFHDGRMVRAFGTFQDISDRRAHEAHLQAVRQAAVAAREQLVTAVESLPDGFVLYDRDDRLVIANERYREIYAASAPAMVPGTQFEDILRYGLARGEYRDAVGREADWLRRRMEQHRDPQGVIEQRLASGRVLRIFERRTPDGGSVGLRVDVTELYDARERAEAANRAKAVFLANMSHELRTPLNAILGMADLLISGMEDPALLTLASTIRDSGESLLAILNDLLDMSKIEAGRMELRDLPFTPAEVVRRVEALYELRAQEKGLRFRVEMGPGAMRPRRGDETRVGQILHNLLSNAVKFTDAGEITLSVQADGPLVLTVADSGIGLPPEDVARIFDDFEQADRSTTRRHGGTGLGLSIVRHLVAMMRGDIRMDSTKGRGTTVTVTLPLPLQETAAPDPATSSQTDPVQILTGKRALIADDNPVNLQILQAYLTKFGVTVTLAENGRQAVDLFRPGAFDLLCLDISMPELDGVAALAEIDRIARAEGARRPPAIAVTANAMPHHVEEYLAAGFEAHLAKPIRRDLTARTLAGLVAAQSSATMSTACREDCAPAIRKTPATGATSP
jgi:PAS domain S-box-containing protein